MKPMPAPATPSETIACPKCGSEMAASIEWCRCVGGRISPSCRACGACVCKTSNQKRREFWQNAPAWLKAGQTAEIDRRNALRYETPATADVLVVDDDEDLRMLTAFSLEEMGYRVAVAPDGPSALEMLSDRTPAVMITDALMPRMDGRELCRTAKERHPFLKVVIMTSLYTSARYKHEAISRFHADEYLAKPIAFETMREILARLAPVPARRRA